jgi:hypothetical protein
MGLNDIIPVDNRVVEESQYCPNCQTDDVNMINRGMVSCENNDCRVYNFSPITEGEL